MVLGSGLSVVLLIDDLENILKEGHPTLSVRVARKRYLVYTCDDSQPCYGWGDRQRAVASLYMLAYLTGREFRLIMTSPCDVTNFYQPHRVQWVPQGDELITDNILTLNLVKNKNLTQSFRKSLETGDFNSKYPQKVIYVKGNKNIYRSVSQNKVYQAAMEGWRSSADVFRWAWGELMSPRLSLLTRLEQTVGEDILVRRGIIQKSVLPPGNLTQTSKSLLLCAHVRYGENPDNPNDQPLTRFNMTDLPLLMEFLEKYDVDGDARLYVASDYGLIRDKFKERFGGKVLEGVGRVIHVDRDRRSPWACEGFYVALLEQLILSVCDHLVITPSGFSKYAAYASNSTHPADMLYQSKFTQRKAGYGWASYKGPKEGNKGRAIRNRTRHDAELSGPIPAQKL